jgi:DNA-binding SARP family transcriptional activator/tetratricopeptide (TPR) repeat protein
MRVQLLGPIDVAVGDGVRPVHGLRRKAVLAVLALHPGEIVSTGRLVDAVWGDSAPPTAGNTLQSHVSHLRQVLGSRASIRGRPPGYLLDLGADASDVEVAERLIRQGMAAADRGERARRLRAALALWRGRPLADVTGLVWLDEQADRLDQLRLRTVRALIEARLVLGEHAHLVPDLERLTGEHPFDEQLHAQLMLALYRTGRQADALAVYRRLRHTLGEDLGIDPSQPVRDLEADILRQDRALDPPGPAIELAAGSPAAALNPAIPAQLPLTVPAFAGRAGELASLDALLPGDGTPGTARPATVVISAVSGTAGVGKTALAVHWAHRVAHRFPDGQLYVNLRGFDPNGAPLDPAEAVRGFLDALGVPAQRIPAGLPAQTALYRSLLAGKRVLVVLDNARGVEQVRPLLPGSPGCMVVVTSRDQLTGLVATEGARPLTLDLLSTAEARELIACRLGCERVAAEPDAVDDIVARCARLPLALAVAAARAATRPGFPLAVLAAELRDATGVLDVLRGGDVATDVRAVFALSYQALSLDAARLFRLLALDPGPDISTPAAASLAGVAPNGLRPPLAELTRAHLLTEHAPGRYTFHDLLRAYAAEQVGSLDPVGDRNAAVHRMLDHYLHTAHAAARLLDPYLEPISLAPRQPGVTVSAHATAEEAFRWFNAEHPALLAAVHLAADAGFDTHTWQLAWTMTTYYLRRGCWQDQTLAQTAGLDAARRLNCREAEAHALYGLALGYARSGRLDDAKPRFERALELFSARGDCANEASVHLRLGWLSARLGRPAVALSHVLQALDLFRAAGNHAVRGRVLGDIGWCHAQLGNHRQALRYCEQALAATRETGERNWEAGTWDSLGFTHRGLGNVEQATVCYRRALDMYRQLGDRYNEAGTLASLGETYSAARDVDAARRTLRAALDIFDELNHPDAELVRAKLATDAEPDLLLRPALR